MVFFFDIFRVLASYNFPAALLAKGSNSITDNILSKATSIRQDGGAEKLYQQLMSIPECVQRNKEIIEAVSFQYI